MRLAGWQWTVVAVVTVMWAATFFLHDLPLSGRVIAQAVFMFILGGLLTVGVIQKVRSL